MTTAIELPPSDPRATVCNVCGRGWDDSVSTDTTPTPAGRCPFEHEHEQWFCGHDECRAEVDARDIPVSGYYRCPSCWIMSEPVNAEGLTAMDLSEIAYEIEKENAR